MIDSSSFTALPAGSDAPYLLLQFRQLLIKNLIGYLNSIHTSIPGLNIEFLINKYKNIHLDKNFSPAIYALFSKLSDSCTSGDVPPIIDVLHQLSLLPEKDIYDAHFKCTTILTERWETDFVNKIRSEHIPSETNDKTIILPIIQPNLNEFENIFFNVTDTIKTTDYDFYLEISNYVTRLKLFNGIGLSASSSASIFGAIYLNIPPPAEDMEVYFVEHIVHETSHLSLELLHAFDKLVLNEDTEKFKSPIRIDPRPMVGIFHATFVLCRMVRLFSRINLKHPQKKYEEKLRLFDMQFREGLETIEKHAKLTEKGKLILQSLAEAAEI